MPEPPVPPDAYADLLGPQPDPALQALVADLATLYTSPPHRRRSMRQPARTP